MVEVFRVRGDEVGAVAGITAKGVLLIAQAAAQEDLGILDRWPAGMR